MKSFLRYSFPRSSCLALVGTAKAQLAVTSTLTIQSGGNIQVTEVTAPNYVCGTAAATATAIAPHSTS